MVRISHKEEITYSDLTQEYSDFFQDHQLVKGERSILAQQRMLEQFEQLERNSKVFQPKSPSKLKFLQHGKQRQE